MRSTTCSASDSRTRASSPAAPRPTTAWWKSSSCRTTPSSSHPSFTRSSTRGRPVRSRCSVTSSARRPSAPRSDRARRGQRRTRPLPRSRPTPRTSASAARPSQPPSNSQRWRPGSEIGDRQHQQRREEDPGGDRERGDLESPGGADPRHAEEEEGGREDHLGQRVGGGSVLVILRVDGGLLGTEFEHMPGGSANAGPRRPHDAVSGRMKVELGLVLLMLVEEDRAGGDDRGQAERDGDDDLESRLPGGGGRIGGVPRVHFGLLGLSGSPGHAASSISARRRWAGALTSLSRVNAEDQSLLARSARLCEIASPTGEERAVADAVLGELRELGVEVEEDAAAESARAAAGNLIARVPGMGDGWISFFAHLDTVPHDGPIEVVLENGRFTTSGPTILGADNKAAVTVLMELAARHAAARSPLGLELVFTVAEEDGLRGASELDISALRAPFGYGLDHATPIGEVIVSAQTYKRLIAEFTGQEAHAGINPEDGHSAIAAAAAAIAGMKLGRLDEETTANVGMIEGGTASNVVAGHCRILGEARSVDGERAAAKIGEMVDACTWAAGEHHCDVDAQVIEMFRGYRLDPKSEAVRVASEALRRGGHEPRLVATGGGSDANALVAAGYETVLLANGTEANHTPEESATESAIVEMLEVCKAATEEAAQVVVARGEG